MSRLRQVPSIDKLMREASLQGFSLYVRRLAARTAVAEYRESLANGKSIDLIESAVSIAQRLDQPSPMPVINASGVILHTGLGRARLAQVAVDRIAAVAASYSAVELDHDTGKRGRRQDAVRSHLIGLTGAEDAFVVNNCAAGVVLALSALCSGKEVILSRGQMVEIGGSFRLPEIVRESGCTLVEVGCTNKTRLDDYREAITERTAALLVCHPSNFEIVGFHEAPPVQELSNLSKEAGILLVNDVGSGCLVDTGAYGLRREPTLQEAIAHGSDIVLASGDKLLGGPQAGVILGRSTALHSIAKHPLARAFRVDKLTLAGLEATLRLYAEGEERQIPIWRDLGRDLSEIEAMAKRIQKAAPKSIIEFGETEVGGGSLPGASVPTWRVGLNSSDPEATLKSLRSLPTPIIARIEDGRVWLDPRTIDQVEIVVVETSLKKIRRDPNG